MNTLPPGWQLTYNPKPIPRFDYDYDFVHDNYDGENGLSGTSSSPEDAIQQIIDIEIDL